MGLLNFFKGKTPEEHERNADSLFSKDLFGEAKIEYEKALSKFKKKSDKNGAEKRLNEKLNHCLESLAKIHKTNADNLIENGIYDEAQDLLRLAFELTKKNNFKEEIKEILDNINNNSDNNSSELYEYYENTDYF